MKYLLIILFLSGCCSYNRDHSRNMFAQGARNYCGELYVKEVIDNNNLDAKENCEEVYSRFFNSF